MTAAFDDQSQVVLTGEVDARNDVGRPCAATAYTLGATSRRRAIPIPGSKPVGCRRSTGLSAEQKACRTRGLVLPSGRHPAVSATRSAAPRRHRKVSPRSRVRASRVVPVALVSAVAVRCHRRAPSTPRVRLPPRPRQQSPPAYRIHLADLPALRRTESYSGAAGGARLCGRCAQFGIEGAAGSPGSALRLSGSATRLADVLIGSHVSPQDPLAAAAAEGADVVQIFLGNPQSWKAPKPREDAARSKPRRCRSTCTRPT